MGKDVKQPPTPNFAGAATAQGTANLDAAIASGQMSNPNYITPTTRRTVTYPNQGALPPGGGAPPPPANPPPPATGSALSGASAGSAAQQQWAAQSPNYAAKKAELDAVYAKNPTPQQLSYNQAVLAQLAQQGQQPPPTGMESQVSGGPPPGWPDTVVWDDTKARNPPPGPPSLNPPPPGQGPPSQAGLSGNYTPTITDWFNLDTPAGKSMMETQRLQTLGDQNLAGVSNDAIARAGGILGTDPKALFNKPLTTEIANDSANIGNGILGSLDNNTQGAYTGQNSVAMGPNIAGLGTASAYTGNPGTIQGAPTGGTAQQAQGPGYLQNTLNAGGYGQAQGGVAAPQLSGLNLFGLGGVQGGPQSGQFGQAQGAPGAPTLRGTLDETGIAKAPVNAGMTGQEAIMSRLAPDIARNRTSTETQLINQGLRPGGEAYDNAIGLLGRQENDQRTQAVLQGLSLDTAANQQGFGQAQARGEFQNQAALSGFGAGVTGAQTGNQAIAQNFQQAQSAAAQGNAAQQQQFQQRVQAGEFGNEAQLASFGAGIQNQQAYNDAISQNFGQGATAQQMQNQAQGQDFSQQLALANQRNQTIGQNFGQALQSQQAGNEAQQQRFQQGTTLADQGNQALAQNQETLLAQQQAQNAAFGQQFGQGMSVQDTVNTAAQKNFENKLTYANANNQSLNQRFNQDLAAGQFGNSAQAQQLQQALQQRQLPLNEIAALMSGQQVDNPQFQAYQGQTAAAGNIQAATAQQGAWDQNIYNQQVAQKNALTQGLFSLGGAATGLIRPR